MVKWSYFSCGGFLGHHECRRLYKNIAFGFAMNLHDFTYITSNLQRAPEGITDLQQP